ncbi:DNA alkylation repair protein [Streptococcus mitis]|uniref:DNA alkylation repair protein n=1 Tax=Streptococcus mitis TaxID=28037 RepID=A0A4U1KYW3_STRMT|nr:DNA alkylation repair protein [Streptococcus mitis]
MGGFFGVLRRLLIQNFGLILFENLFKPRQFYLQPQSSALSNLRLAS